MTRFPKRLKEIVNPIEKMDVYPILLCIQNHNNMILRKDKLLQSKNTSNTKLIEKLDLIYQLILCNITIEPWNVGLRKDSFQLLLRQKDILQQMIKMKEL